MSPSGTVSSSSLSTLSRSSATAVLTSGDGVRSSWYSPVACSTSLAAAMRSLSCWWESESTDHTSSVISEASFSETTLWSTSWRANSSRTDGCFLITWYISGWV